MTLRPLFTDDERRVRLAHRHRLTPAGRGDTTVDVTRSLVGLHSSDPVSVYLSAAQRMTNGSIEAIEHALYDQRSVVRHHAMRRTLWVMPLDIAMAAHSSTTMALVRPQRKKFADHLVQSGVTTDPHDWIDTAGADMLRQLAKRGEASTRELGEALPQYTVPMIAPGAGSLATIPAGSAHSRLLVLLGFVGVIVRARPIGSWVSGQYRWSLSSTWTGREWSDDMLPAAPEAQVSIVHSYLHAFGPATLGDVKWWTGWTKGNVERALRGSGAIEVDTEAGPAYVAADDVAEVHPNPGPWVALLPSLDPTTMGWKHRQWYLDDELAAQVFDRNGNAGPTVWVDGRVVGAWGQRPDGSIAVSVEPQSAVHTGLLADEVARLERLVGDSRFKVRFQSPLGRRLADITSE